MRHFYTCILASLSLALTLGACSSDKETKASRRPDSPATARSAPRPAKSAGTAAADSPELAPATARRLRNTVLAPAAASPPPDLRPPAALRAPRRARRVLRRAVAAAAAAAPAPPAVSVASPPRPADEKAPVSDEPQPQPAPGPVAATPAADGPKTAQTFLIRPDHDTVLYGTEGTVMRIPAGTFVQGRGTAPKGLLAIQLREFYSMADILLERLNTQAGPQLLETGGMVQLSATTADGKACKIKPGGAFELGFPATRPIDGMQLYNGQATKERGLTWKLAPQQPKSRNLAPHQTKSRKPKSYTHVEPWHRPRFRGGYVATRRRLRRKIAFAPATVRRLNGDQSPGQLRRELRRQHKRVPVVAQLQASFELSETGRVEDVWVRQTGPADSVLQATVRQALQQLEAEPGRRGDHAVRSMMKVDVRFMADRRVQVGRLRWDQRTTTAFYKADAERKATGRGRLTDAQLQAAPLSELTAELYKKNRGMAKRYTVGKFLGEQLGYVKELAVFRVTAVVTPRAVMGTWYNCDRPVPLLTRLTAPTNVRAPKGGLARLALVRLGLEHPTTQPADISLVLRERRSVLRGNTSGSRVMFEQLADSTAGTLVAIRREQGQLYLGLRDVVVSQRTEPPLTFQPVTVAELRAALARFDL